MMTDLNDRWNGLPAPTRQWVVAGVVVIAALLLYSAVWLPLGRDLDRLRVTVPREAEQLNWMRAQTPTAKTMRTRMTATTGPALPTIEQSATARGVRAYIVKLDAEGNNGARLTIEAAPFNALMVWISEMQASQGILIDDATIEAHATPGLVNARLRLRTGGT